VTETISVVICGHNMPRELPRTIRSLSPAMQKQVEGLSYELILVDNGSTPPLPLDECVAWGADVRLIEIAPASASQSPVRGLNLGIEGARGDLIGAMIDGARLASPGLIAAAAQAAQSAERAVILTPGFHLGPSLQMHSIPQGYDQDEEDRLLAGSGWTEDGYRLFDVSVFSASCQRGWFSPMSESNAIFMRRTLWTELGGFDERFQTPGGGLANLDLLARAVKLPGAVVITLLGEGTCHPVHGGVSTNSNGDLHPLFWAEYEAITGSPFQAPAYRSRYLGSSRHPAAIASRRRAATALRRFTARLRS
jgi:glycosyltransferase involved in cell wall biosynthesis